MGQDWASWTDVTCSAQRTKLFHRRASSHEPCLNKPGCNSSIHIHSGLSYIYTQRRDMSSTTAQQENTATYTAVLCVLWPYIHTRLSLECLPHCPSPRFNVDNCPISGPQWQNVRWHTHTHTRAHWQNNRETTPNTHTHTPSKRSTTVKGGRDTNWR